MEPGQGSGLAPEPRRLRVAGGAATSAELALRILDSLGAPRMSDPRAALRAYAAHLRSLGRSVAVEIAGAPPSAPEALGWLREIGRAFPGALEIVLEAPGEGETAAPRPRPAAGAGVHGSAGPGARPAAASPVAVPTGPRRLAWAAAGALAAALVVGLAWIAGPAGLRATGSGAPAAPEPVSEAAPPEPEPAPAPDAGPVRVDAEGRVGFDVADMPLAELLRHLEARIGLRVTSLVGDRLLGPVTARADALPPEQALALALRDFEAIYSFREDGGLEGVLILAERHEGDDEAVALAVERFVETGEPAAWQEAVAVLSRVGPHAAALEELRELEARMAADPAAAGRIGLARIGLRTALCRAWGPEVADAIRPAGIELACQAAPESSRVR